MEARRDIRALLAERTTRPFGVNIPISFVQDPTIVDMLVEERVDFVTTSAGSARKYTPILKDAGLTVLHVVVSLEAARRAVDAGVDGLIVEGSEGAGLRGRQEILVHGALAAHHQPPRRAGHRCRRDRRWGVHGRRLRPWRRGSADGNPDAGFRRVGVDHNLKQAILDASETDTVMLTATMAVRCASREPRPQRRSSGSSPVTRERATGAPSGPRSMRKGEIEGSLPCVGQVSGRIDEVLPGHDPDLLTLAEFHATPPRPAEGYLSAPVP